MRSLLRTRVRTDDLAGSVKTEVMKNRLLYGTVMFIICASVLILTFYVSGLVYDIFILILMILAAHEMTNALAYKFDKPGFLMQVITILVSYALFKTVSVLTFNNDPYGFHAIMAYFIALVSMAIIIFVANMASSRRTGESVIASIFCMIYPVMIMFFLIAINHLPGAEKGLAFTDWVYESSTPNFRAISIIMVFIAASSSDIFAFAFGCTLKGPKFAPMISPKKTIAGAMGGFLGGIIGGAIVFGISFTGVGGLTGLHNDVWISLVLYLSLGLCIGVATEVGDLMASYIKRYCGVKDYSTLIPGHGGIMDRIDGMMIAAFVTYIYMAVLVYVTS